MEWDLHLPAGYVEGPAYHSLHISSSVYLVEGIEASRLPDTLRRQGNYRANISPIRRFANWQTLLV